LLSLPETGIILGKLFLSLLLGAIIGYERETHGQAAGLRTNVLVCMSGCLLMLLSLHMTTLYSQFTDDSVIRIDPGRIASYAIAGMGFLGAGAIIKGRGTVRGLTTAAGLWMVTALGMAIGAGFIVPAVATALFSVPVLFSLRFFKPIMRHDEHTLLTVTCCTQERPLKQIKAILGEYKQISIKFVDYREDLEREKVTYTFRLLSKNEFAWNKVVGSLLELPCVKHISWQEAEVY
jgi:putative Mg2+ transporter-C (MgtC) family protein